MPRVQRSVDDIGSCEFYHVIDLPSGTTTPGQWDIRGHAPEYLGDVNFHSKQVIEIGPASGFLSFYMEECGAKVTCIEPPLSDLWDFVPQRAQILDPFKAGFIGHIQRIRNGFWYCHTQRRSKVTLYEESAYALPSTLGRFDVGVLAAILLHCSSPVRLIQSMAHLVEKTIIITDLFFPDLEGQPVSRLPQGQTIQHAIRGGNFLLSFLLTIFRFLVLQIAACRFTRRRYMIRHIKCSLLSRNALRIPQTAVISTENLARPKGFRKLGARSDPPDRRLGWVTQHGWQAS
jgi:hypothetical protein